jgi:hypothetical protein
MKKAIFAASLLLLFATTASADTWEKLREEAGNFTVSVPGKPVKHTQTVDTEVGKVDAIYYLVELQEGQIVYAAAYNDYPKDFAQNADVEAVLDGVRNGNIKPHNGTVIDESKIKLDGYPGREYTFKGKLGGDGEPINGHVRLFLVGNRLYQLIVLSSADTPAPKEDIGRFFFSFDRTKK